MTEYMTEQEQIEQLKNWIKQYGMTILAGVVLAMVLVTGWHYWDQRQNRILTHASNIYDELLTLRAQNDTNAAVIQANKLLNNYPKTPYAKMAALLLAREATLKKDYLEALKQLQWVISHSNNAAVRTIAKVRIARILVTEQKPQAALDTLRKIYDKNFNGLADEIRGDAFLAMNDAAKAKTSYQLALQELPNDEAIRRPILQMKLDNLAAPSDAIG